MVKKGLPLENYCFKREACFICIYSSAKVLSVHGVVNHESCGPAPHNTAGIDENGCGYRADDAVVCVSALLESVSGLLESVSGAGAAFRAVNAPCLRKKKKKQIKAR